MFQAKHSTDCTKSDKFTRWWLEWYGYHTDAKTNELVYDHQIQIRPDKTPPSETHVQWATILQLYGHNSIVLLGPIEFQPCGMTSKILRTLQLKDLHHLKKICVSNNLPTPTFGTKYLLVPPVKKKRKRKKC